MNSKILGNKGEILAQQFLVKQKYKIICTNYKTKIGEIDIICEQKNVIIFVEVKTRTTQKFGLPREAVTEYKQNKIKLVAKQYLQENKMFAKNCRFDVIEIIDENISHIIGAFI